MKKIKRLFKRIGYAYDMQSPESKMLIIVLTATTAMFLLWLLTTVYYEI